MSRLAPQAAVAQTGPPGSCCPDGPPKQLLPRLAHQAAVAQTGPPSSCCQALLLHISTIIQIMLEYVHAPCITICTTCTASIRHASTGFGTGVYKYIYIYICIHSGHRRRMETEGKAKVVALVWGAKFVQFLAALAVLSRSIWKKRLNSTVSSK